MQSIKYIIAAFVILLSSNADALYLYVKTTGSGGSRTATAPGAFGWADADCYGTIGAAETAALGSDEIVIADGSYAENVTVNGIDGSAGNYTIIRALNDWGVTLNITSGYGFTVQDNYVIVRGIKTSGGVHVDTSNHVKIIRCSATYSGGTWTFLSNASSYVLFEESFAYGGSHRYMFGAGGASSYIVVRKCLGRWDYSTFGLGYPLGTFANYTSGSGNVAFQNCIAIDGTNNISYTGTYRGIKGFKTPNGSENTTIDGCIVLNFDGTGVMLESGSTNFTINNSVVWDLVQTDGSATYAVAWGIRTYGGDDNLTVSNLTMGDNQTGNTGFRIGASETGSSLTDSIFYSISGTATDSGMATQTDNLYYANGANGTTGTNPITGTDPTTARLLYLPRIETGAQGATLVYRIGNTATAENEVGGSIDSLSGLLWGEAGWNTLTSNDLWPYPQEDQIKTDCAAFSMDAEAAYTGSPAMNGARGFAAAGTQLDGSSQITLTSYIWEYLGNQIPADIYGASPDPKRGISGVGVSLR